MSIETLMMIAFVAALALSGWKLYHFIPTKPLPDDDSDEASKNELTQLMLQIIDEKHSHENPLSEAELFEYIVSHERFDKAHYWRFNRNKLNQLMRRYYLKYPQTGSIPAIYRQIREEKEEERDAP
jgi:hypothetical protein